MKNTWKAVTSNGVIAHLTQREDGTWWWSVTYSDGSGYRFDWNPSRRSATDEVKRCIGGMSGQRPLPRFKKMKN